LDASIATYSADRYKMRASTASNAGQKRVDEMLGAQKQANISGTGLKYLTIPRPGFDIEREHDEDEDEDESGDEADLDAEFEKYNRKPANDFPGYK
jgi:hypothetical protein